MILAPLMSVLPLMVPDLPTGPTPLPAPMRHFPDRLHAFVWRNWQLAPANRMAKVVGARTADIVQLGRSMGLTGPPRISPDQFRRSHVSIIRRNWHILPYEQLLTLLGWTSAQLAYALREDDFLYIKLGSLKPQCDPLVFHAPDAHAQLQAARIAASLKELFPNGVGMMPKAPFSFVKELSTGPVDRGSSARDRPPRYCYSYFGLYGDPFGPEAGDPYPPAYLTRLSRLGVNGVWLQAVLPQLHPLPWAPELSQGAEVRLKKLGAMARQARRSGIGLYLYLNEPRAMPLSFYAHHPELKGADEGDHAALCTSAEPVRRYLTDAIEAICRAAPDLAGFFTISMSENLTNCFSHGGAARCPRCSTRTGSEVIGELHEALWNGIRNADGQQQLIAWDWGWPDAWAQDAIAHLPTGVTFMSVSEWSLPITRGGVASEVGEYSISSVGPGPRAERHWACAQERGLKTLAKVQAGATWEMSAMPYVPVLRLIAEHAANLRRAGVQGAMLGWTLGGYPSPNLEVFNRVLDGEDPERSLQAVAEKRYGKDAADEVVRAWDDMSQSFREFPYHIGVVYTGPQQLGPANPLWLEPTGYRATMVGFPYDDLDAWRSIYPPDVFIAQMDKTAAGFTTAADRLEALSDRGVGSHSAVQLEAGLARACAIHFTSVADQARFILRRSQARTDTVRDELRDILHREIERARRLYYLQCEDPRIGFEATNQYYYLPLDLVEKALNCRELLSRL